MRKHITFLSSVLLIVFCFSLSVFAQENYGEIQGTIKDSAGAVVPGVQVTISGVDVGLNRTIQTDDQGYFRARQLPPGVYKVEAAAVSGFNGATNNTVQVALGNATTVDFTLTPSGGTPNVVNVEGDAGVILDATETKAQDNISAREIDALPKGTGFTSLLKTTASVRPEPLGGQFSINGATGPENSFIVDGQEVQNYATGLINTNNDIPYQSIQEIQVKTSGFEAEFGGATGGVINAVTKSGSNQFRGEFGVNLNTQRLNAGPRSIPSTFSSTSLGSTANGASLANSGQGIETLHQSRDRGANFYPTALLSGPVIKNKLWFFGIHSPRVVNTERTTTYISGFGSTRVLTNLSSALVAAGATNTETFRDKVTYNYSQIRLDASPFQSLRLSANYTWNPIVEQGQLPGGSFTTGSPALLTVNGQTYQGSTAAPFKGGRQNSNNLRFEGVYVPTGKLVLLGRYTRGFQNERLGSYGIPSATQYVCSNVPAALAAVAGCTQGFSTAANSQTYKNISLRTTIDAQVSYLFSGLGHHEVKGGYQNSKIFNDTLSGNVGPGRTYLYYGVNCFSTSFTYVQWKITSGNTYPCPANSIGTGVTYQFGGSGNATNKVNGFFVQDKWQPTSRLTLNLGIRDEQENIPSFGSNSINLKFSFKDKFAPRIGVAYALTSDSKTKISAFYGRFFDRLKFALPQGSFGGQFYHVSYFYITADRPNYTNYTVANLKGNFTFPNGGQCPITSGSAYVCDQDYRIASNVIGADVLTNGAVDPNIKPYRQSEYTLEFQREVMRASVFTARGLYRHLDQAIEDAGIPTAAGEAYVIGNPGQGLAASLYKQLGYNKSLKPTRNYKALQLELDTRYVRNFNLNFNYTLSRLSGNYSGLASPDEVSVATGIGRTTTPNVNRDFDEPWVGFTASGQEATGVLPLDRTHVFKASGTYSFDWYGSKASSTDLSFFTTAESGTPLTTFVSVFGIPIPETKRGDLGRTKMFTQTDLNLSQRYKFGNDGRYTVAFDFNVINAFNQNHIIAVNQNKSSGFFTLDQTDVCASGDSVCATNLLTSRGVLSQYAAAESAFVVSSTVFGVNSARNVAFKQPIAFQEPRSVRFGLRFIF